MEVSTFDPDAFLPLSPAVFHILLALSDGEMHGYAIMREVESSTSGKIKMGPGTLYGAIKKLLVDGLIIESEERPDSAEDDERRRYYKLSAQGARVLNAELNRMRMVLRSARGRKLVRPVGGMA